MFGIYSVGAAYFSWFTNHIRLFPACIWIPVIRQTFPLPGGLSSCLRPSNSLAFVRGQKLINIWSIVDGHILMCVARVERSTSDSAEQTILAQGQTEI